MSTRTDGNPRAARSIGILGGMRGVAVVAFSLLVVAAAAGAEGRPAVALTDTEPVSVRGLRFDAGERVTVRVVVRGKARQTKLVRAGRTGTFTATFATLAVTDCDVYTVQALGWRGSRATYAHLPPPCGPSR